MMTFIDIVRKRQIKPNSCGAACTQMVLHFLRLADLKNTTQQRYINQIQGFPSVDSGINWGASPDGLEFVLNNNYNLSQATQKFNLKQDRNAISITNTIVNTIKNFGVPPITLVLNQSHWVVVNGFDDNGLQSSNNLITSLWVTNPLPASQNSHIQGNINYDDWLFRYVGLVANGGHFDGFYLAVCDPPDKKRTPKGKTGSDKRESFLNIQSMKPQADSSTDTPNDYTSQTKNEKEIVPKNIKKGGKILDSTTIKKRTVEAMKERGFTKVYFLKNMLRNYKTGAPVLVQQIDRKNDFYHIVPLIVKNGHIHALVCMDGLTGNYSEASFLTNGKRPIKFSTLNKAEILKILRKKLKNDDISKELPSYPEVLVVYPTLVWRPCVESFSRLMPFYMILLEDRRVYVRIDGEVFQTLTTDVSGY